MSYNQWRNILAAANTEREAETHWVNIDDNVSFWKNGIVPKNMPADPYDVPFVDAINFSDCEGVMVEKSIERLHRSVVDVKTLVDDMDCHSTKYQKFVDKVNSIYGRDV